MGTLHYGGVRHLRGAKCQSVASALRENLQQIIDVNKLELNHRLARYRHRRFRLT